MAMLLLIQVGAGCRFRDEGTYAGGERDAGPAPARAPEATAGQAGASGGAAGTAGAQGGPPSDGPDAAAEAGQPDAPSDRPVETTAEVPPEDVPPDQPAEVPPRSKPDGSPCQVALECASNVCAKGICCNQVCNDPCYSCARTGNGVADGRCEISREMVGRKCGQGCQQVVPGTTAVVDKTCDAQGRCVLPAIPLNTELCVDTDPCTTLNCDQDTALHTARCVKVGCAAGQCCCQRDGAQMCLPTAMCTGMGRSCAP